VSQLAGAERRDDVASGYALAGSKLVIGTIERRVQARPIFLVKLVPVDDHELDLGPSGRFVGSSRTSLPPLLWRVPRESARAVGPLTIEIA
jgi:hypothetical protein